MTDQRAVGVILHDFSLGGSERVAIRLANAWAKSGRRTILYVGDGTGPQRTLVNELVRIEMPKRSIIRSKWSLGKLALWAANQSRKDNVAAIFLPGNSYYKATQPLIKATDNLVPLYAVISNLLWRPERSWVRNIAFAAITRWRLKDVHAAIAMSPTLAVEARKILGGRIGLQTIPNAVFDTLPQQMAVARVPWQICAVGRLEPQKDFSLLLKSVAKLVDLPITLKIAGDGSLRHALEREAVQLGIADRVEFLGAISNVQPCIAQSELFVMTSEFEGYPSVIVEALAMATFVIARHCSPAIPELLHRPCIGAIVSGSNPADFARAIRKFFQTPLTDAQAMKAVATKHMAPSVARHYLELFGLLPLESIG